MEQVKSHSENFNLDILKIRKIKNETHADSSEENLEFVTSDEALDLYEEDQSPIVDQNSRKLIQKTNHENPEKNQKKYKREKELNKRVYLSLEHQEYVSQFGEGKRKNAGVGLGIKNLIEMFIPMKKRNDHQVKRIVLFLNQLELATNEVAKMKLCKKDPEAIEAVEKDRMSISLKIVYHLSLFGFTEVEINKFLNDSQKLLLKNALDKHEIFKMEKSLEELEGPKGIRI